LPVNGLTMKTKKQEIKGTQNLSTKPTVVVMGGFDNVRSPQVRFLHEASRLGNLHVILWSDEMLQALNGAAPKFSQSERLYFVESLRYVSQVSLINTPVQANTFPDLSSIIPGSFTWVVDETNANALRESFCATHQLGYHVLTTQDLAGFPLDELTDIPASNHKKRALVTGCYDWMHSGHVRFFEEASEFGDLFVVVGHDANLRLLKGEGHPLFPEDERRYMVQSVRFVTRALISSGSGWMDAEPEIDRIKPAYYVVNEDGDKPEKRNFCSEHDIEYKILKRLPKPGLPRRESTQLRGF
jgi:cytidyltransferase-like protein